MRAATEKAEGEVLGNWQNIVEAVWTINYVSSGFKGFLPRLQNLDEPLGELERLIPAIEQKSMLEVLELELNQMDGQFREVADRLAAETERIHNVKVQFERHRAALSKPVD